MKYLIVIALLVGVYALCLCAAAAKRAPKP